MSCLFRTLSHFISGVSTTQMRKLICDYLSKNPKLFDNVDANNITSWGDNMSLDNYVNKMRRSSTWGGGIEIKCFCNMFNLIVKVHFNGKEIEFLSDEPKGEISIKYTGNHYEPISAICLL